MTDEKTETLEERKARLKANAYPIKLPPREVEVVFENDDATIMRYVLKRPSLGERNALLRDMGAFAPVAVVGDEADKNWRRIIQATVVYPHRLTDAEINDMDAFVADRLYVEGNKLVLSSSLTEELKNKSLVP